GPVEYKQTNKNKPTNSKKQQLNTTKNPSALEKNPTTTTLTTPKNPQIKANKKRTKNTKPLYRAMRKKLKIFKFYPAPRFFTNYGRKV
ncbi:hypothetical protein ACNISP_26505, partial [Escherichia coli]